MTERITEENRAYIKGLRVSDVPWHRLTTVYGRATAFPEYFAVLEEMRDADGVREAFEELGYNVEHQDTLWHATPFASVFLARILGKALRESAENPVAAYLAEQLTELFDCATRTRMSSRMRSFTAFTIILGRPYSQSERRLRLREHRPWKQRSRRSWRRCEQTPLGRSICALERRGLCLRDETLL